MFTHLSLERAIWRTKAPLRLVFFTDGIPKENSLNLDNCRKR
jgi:hypothetical protein